MKSTAAYLNQSGASSTEREMLDGLVAARSRKGLISNSVSE